MIKEIMDMSNEKDMKKARRKAIRMQTIMKLVIKNSLGGYCPAKEGIEEFITTRHGDVRVLKYGFEDESVLPVYFDMHGGGFIMMQADVDEKMNLLFQKQANIKIISIDYPKAPQNPYPIAVEVVHDVVRYFVDSSQNYGILTSSIGIGGHSAGANLATVTCINNLKQKEFDIAYQVLDFPPLDLVTSPYDKPCPIGCISPKDASMYDLCYTNPEQRNDVNVSPVCARIEELTGMPKTLLIVCGKDSLYNEGITYAEKLKEAGVSVQLEKFLDSCHGFTYFEENDDVHRAFKLMADFIAVSIKGVEDEKSYYWKEFN